MEWLLNDGYVSVLLYLAILIELLGFTLVLLEGLRPRRARFIERWIGQQVNRKPFVARVKEIFKFGDRKRPDIGWLVFSFVVIAFYKMIVGVFDNGSPFDGIFYSLVRGFVSVVFLACGVVVFRVVADLAVRWIVWGLEKLSAVTHDRAVGGLGVLLLFAGLVANVFQIVLR